MVIQVGSIYMNNTWKYLSPILSVYGKEFVTHFNNVWKVAVGIGDMMLIKNNIRYEQHLFILIDTKSGRRFFSSFLRWIKDQEMYEDDYCFDDINHGQLHMIVVKMPPEGYKAIQQFKHSQFSKMFTIDEINKYFKDNPDVSKVLVKDNHYKFEFVNKLNYLWETTVTPEEYEGELSLPIKQSKEFFNANKKKGK